VYTLTILDDIDPATGMLNDWVKAIVDADLNDDIASPADVLPDDDFDRDGMSNLFEMNRGTDPTKYELQLRRGWNLISVAAVPDDNSIANLLGAAARGAVWVQSEQGQHSVPTDELLPNRGHWVYAGAAALIDIGARLDGVAGSDRDGDLPQLRPGWNLISVAAVADDNSIAAILGAGTVRGDIAWVWSATDQRYISTTELLPLQGHLVFVDAGR
jgi:hypothetical protein